jgi:hypothetical protein
MKGIILDHLRRWWLILFILCAAYSAPAGWSVVEFRPPSFLAQDVMEDQVAKISKIFFAAISYPLLLWIWLVFQFDLQRGLARSVLSLPLTSSQIGRAWWLASVGMPAAGLILLTLVATLIFSQNASSMVRWDQIGANSAGSVIFLGAVFGVSTFQPIGIPESFREKFRALFWAACLVLPLFGCVYMQIETPTQGQIVLVFSALTFLTVIGWFRTERLVIRRAGFRAVSQQPRTRSACYVSPTGLGGTRFLLQTMSTRAFYMILIIPIYFVALFGVMARLRAQPMPWNASLTGFGTAGTNWLPWFVLLFLLLPIISHLRVLRTLPISSSSLASLLVFVPTAAMLALGLTMGTITSVLSGSFSVWLIPQGFVAAAALLALCVPIFVWQGVGTTSYLVLFLVIVAGSLFPLLGNSKSLAPAILAGGVALVALAFFLTRWLLRRSSAAYRVRATPGFGWPAAGR